MNTKQSETPAATSPNVIDALWRRYRATGDPAARTQLLDRYLGLVHHVARQVAARVADVVEVDDLVSAGTLGLVQALESFDLSRGLAFSTYAMRRIRGAILDELRSRDWVPRSVRAKGRQMAAAVAQLEGRLGRAPEPQEVATALSLDMETYWRWREEVDGAVLVSIDGSASVHHAEPSSLEETLRDPNALVPGARLDEEETVTLLRGAIELLPAKERTVLALYYYEELNLREIAEVLHVTESRVSQIRTQALNRLRQRLTPSEEHA
ncbi:MAG TPA: FliA/WhiG family RNA polymerase sigma factor [Gemmatimonadales bacterium]|nr:FliA/WhiG family RNA polymerase sigma factor [Gemmatimonadales bacterium]